MNTILIDPSEWASDKHPFELTISDRRAEHIAKVLKPSTGDHLKVGKINGLCGKVKVQSIDLKRTVVSLIIDPLQITHSPPQPLPLTLIVALPRPKTARRIVRTATELGIKAIHFINSYKVEKSYWQSPLLTAEKLQEQILMGLEQANDTVLPDIQFHPLFKPFIEDKFDAITADKITLLGDTSSTNTFEGVALPPEKAIAVVIGPEGGFTPYETNKLNQAGCVSVSLGERILRTETVVPYICAKIGYIYSAKT